ncbi:3-oxoadipate enol-lactonase [Falsigemmobacter intermedius]|uniref:3-oxoadipate enol-lactonase n=1 Tax=Falsigemmobacter intermedius TaxID=1553448 RepID=UPI003F05614A
MQFLTRPDAQLHIRDEGPRDGRVVVFANSLGTDLRVWDQLIALLPKGLRLIRFDKRGHGLSDASPAPYSMDLLVEDAEALCDHLGVKDVTFIGLSIGGLIGQGLAAKRPDLVKALILMDTAAKIGTAEMWNARIAAVREGGLLPMGPAIMERWFTAPFRETRAEFALWTNMLTRTTVEGYVGCCAAIAGADLTESTRALTLPVEVLCGDQDGSTPPDLVRATAALCNAPFRLIPDAGHIPCVEQPEATAQLITDFLERTAA